MSIKRALLVGINRYEQAPLEGCIRDVAAVAEHLQREEGFDAANIHLVTDERATKDNIMAELCWLLYGASEGDVLFFHFSGHGVQMATRNEHNEIDGLDECICPVNFDWTDERTIRDKELARAFADTPSGVNLTWISDSCHSGDLQRALPAPGVVPRTIPPPLDIAWAIHAAREKGCSPKALPSFRGVLLSACQSHQTAADAPIGPGGERYGAFTYLWLKTLRANPTSTLKELASKTAYALASAHFGQQPALQGTKGLFGKQFLEPAAGYRGEVAAVLSDKDGLVEVSAQVKDSVIRDIPGDLVGSGYIASGPGAKIRYDVETTDPQKIQFVLRLADNLTWWKSLDVFTEVNGVWVSGGRRIEVKDNNKEASIDVYWWEATTALRVEFWKAGILNFGAFVVARQMNRDSNLGKRLVFTWEAD